MSSKRSSHDSGKKKPSVFERLGSKSSISVGNTSTPSVHASEDYCKQWANKGSCTYGNKCKYLSTHKSSTKPKLRSPRHSAEREKDAKSRGRNDRDSKNAPPVSSKKTNVPSKVTVKPGRHEKGWEAFDDKSLEHEDERALERKREMLKRELELQLLAEEREHKVRKVPPKKRRRSSSSSSSSSSSTDSSSDSSDSSSSSSRSSSSSSSSSSDSDGEVRDKKTSRKKGSSIKRRSRSSSSGRSHQRGKRQTESIKKRAKALQRKSDANDQATKTRPHESRHTEDGLHRSRRISPTASRAAHSRSPGERVRDRDVAGSRFSGSPERPDRYPEPWDETRDHGRREVLGRGREEILRDRSRERHYERERDRFSPREQDYLLRARSPIPGRSGSAGPYRDYDPVPQYKDRALKPNYDIREARGGYSRSPHREMPYERVRHPLSPEPPPIGHRSPVRPRDYYDLPPNASRDWPPFDEHERYRKEDLARREHAFRRNRDRHETGDWPRERGASDIMWKRDYSPGPMHDFPPKEPGKRVWDNREGRMGYRRDDRNNKYVAPHKKPEMNPRGKQRPSEDNRRPKNLPDDERVMSTATAATTVAKTVKKEPAAAASPSVAAQQNQLSPGSTAKVEKAEKIEKVEKLEPLAEDLSDFSDDADEILNCEAEATVDDKDSNELNETVASDADLRENVAASDSESRPKPAVQAEVKREESVSPVPFETQIDSRADEDLLGGMDIEQISDEELEEESKPAFVDALDVDWASLASLGPSKQEQVGGSTARQRWEGPTLLAKIGISSSLIGEKIPGLEHVTQSCAALYTATLERQKQRDRIFNTAGSYRRALCARVDLSIRRTFSDLPVREIRCDPVEENVGLYKSAVESLLNSVPAQSLVQ